jgi:transcriptional regulator with GAF, ATPase, and Fis domain
MKWIPYQGLKWPLPELAELLRVERATLARRVREYEAGRMSLEQVVSCEKLPSKPPPRKPWAADADRLRALLAKSKGHYAPIARALGVTTSRVQQMVKRYGLEAHALSLREQDATSLTAPAA